MNLHSNNKIIVLILCSVIITPPTLILAQSEQNSTELFDKGIDMEKTGNLTEAIKIFDKILENDPNNVKALIEKSVIFDSNGNVTAALGILNKTLEIDPNNVNALLDKGIILSGLDEFKEASLYINKTLEIDPNNVKALTDQAIIFSAQHKYHDALNVINKALSIDPSNTDAIYDKQSIYGSIGMVNITPKSGFNLYFQLEIQNSAGQMVAYIESPQSLIQYLNDTSIIDHVLNSLNATKTIFKDGKEYDVIQIKRFITPNSTGFNGVEELVLNDTSPIEIFEAQLHGYTFESGDVITEVWTLTRPHQ